MNAPLDDRYFTWLYSQISSLRIRNKTRSHWELARQLFSKEFIWLVPNDDNRAVDGQDLRHEFIQALNIHDVDPDWMRLNCSMLEMLIALSRRLSFIAEHEPREWFWELMEHLELTHVSDADYNDQLRQEVNDVLDRVIWRTYSPNGHGGLFPLQNARKDQRSVEIWYQLSAFLVEGM